MIDIEDGLTLIFRRFDHAPITTQHLDEEVARSEAMLVNAFFESPWRTYGILILLGTFVFSAAVFEWSLFAGISPGIIGLGLGLIGSFILAQGLLRGPSEITALSFTGFVEAQPGNPTGHVQTTGIGALIPLHSSDAIYGSNDFLIFDHLSRLASAKRTIQVLFGVIFLIIGFFFQGIATLI